MTLTEFFRKYRNQNEDAMKLVAAVGRAFAQNKEKLMRQWAEQEEGGKERHDTH